MDPIRIVAHVDLDAFFASVEQYDHPEYRNKPVIVGADPKNGKGRGVVATCSYEARKFGIHSAMPISQAWKLCPQGIYVHSHFGRYEQISEQVMNILQNWGTAFQQGGIDEAYIELTDKFSSFSDGEVTAREIQDRILNEIGISASIGIAPNKSLAKIASDYRKPHGIVIILPGQIQSFLSPLEITKIHGIGKKTQGFWFQAGINTIGDLYRWNKEKLIKYFSVQGEWAWNVAHGLDNRPVLELYERKSIGAERTFLEDTADLNRVIKILLTLNSRLHEDMTSKKIHYRTIGIKIRFQGYETFTRAISLSSPIRNEQVAAMKVFELMNEFARYSKKIRLVGLRFSGLSDEKIPHYQTVLNFTSIRKKAIPNDEFIYSSRSVDNGK